MKHIERKISWLSVKLPRIAECLFVPCALFALSLTACGSSSDTTLNGNGSAAGASAVGDDDVGKILDGAEPCTKPHTICVSVPVPADMTESPASLQFDIYDSPGAPNHPPNGFAGSFTSPQVTAGKMTYFELSDAGLQGDFWIWSIAYMASDGHGAPVVGLDYLQVSAPPAIHLDGSPLNIAQPILLKK